jgi:hypothetical protein
VRAFLITLIILGLLGTGGWLGYNKLFPRYDIVCTYRSGEIWEQTMKWDMSTPQGNVRMPIKTTVKTLRVHPDGSADMEERFEIGQGISPALAAQMKGIHNKTTRVRTDKHGQRTVLSSNIDASLMSLAQSSENIYPTKTIRKGEQWERTISRNGIETKNVYKLLGTERLSDRECYKIVSKINSAPGSQTPIEGIGTFFIDCETGWVVKSSGSAKMSMAGMNMTILFDMTAKRIASTKKPPPKKQPINKKR